MLQVVLSLNAGGTERMVLELVRRLHTHVPMAVCCLDDKGLWADELTREQVPVTALGRTAGFQPSLGRAIARLAGSHQATVVHCHHYSPFVYGALARIWGARARVVFTEHGRLSDAGPSGKRRLANRVFARLSSASFAVSGDLRDHLCAEGFGAADVGVIYNGIDVGSAPTPEQRAAVRQRAGVSDRTLVIGTVARLDPVKDLGTLIRAVAELPASAPALLLIVGDGAERASLEALTRECSAQERVRFLGHRDDARTWLQGCDVYVNCSISEGVSLTILEAMAAALPVVATRVGGTPEVVTGDCGRLVPSRDPAALRQALLELSMDSALRLRCGRSARERVEARFTLERMVGEYRAVYERLS